MALPQEWRYDTQMSSEQFRTDVDMPEDIFYGQKVHVYHSLHHAAMWNRYRAARIVTLRIIAKVLEFSSPLTDTDSLARQACATANVQTLVDDICASVPFHFGQCASVSQPVVAKKDDPDAWRADRLRRSFFLVWPLVISSAIAVIPEQQRNWIKSKLLFVSKTTGNDVLKVVAKTDDLHKRIY